MLKPEFLSLFLCLVLTPRFYPSFHHLVLTLGLSLFCTAWCRFQATLVLTPRFYPFFFFFYISNNLIERKQRNTSMYTGSGHDRKTKYKENIEQAFRTQRKKWLSEKPSTNQRGSERSDISEPVLKFLSQN